MNKLSKWWKRNNFQIIMISIVMTITALLSLFVWFVASLPEPEPIRNAMIVLDSGEVRYCEYITTYQGVVRGKNCDDGLDYLGGIIQYTEYGRTTIVSIE